MGVISAGVRLESFADTKGFTTFQKSLRDLRLNMLGFEQVATVMRGFGDSLVALGKVGSQALVKITKEAVEFDDIMTQVVSIQTELKPIVGDLSDSFLELANTLPISASELGKTAIQAARAGVTSKTALEAIALASSKLAAISDSLTEEGATKALVTISKNFQVSIGDMASNTIKLADQMARLERVGIATAGAIAVTATQASAAGKAFGLTETQLLALSAAAINTGVSAGVAGTGITNFLTRISANVGRVAKVINIGEKEFRKMIDTGNRFDTVTTVLEKLRLNADGSTRTASQLSEAMKAAGLGGKKLGNLVKALSSRLVELKDTNKVAEEATGSLQKRFEIASESMQKKIDTLVGSIRTIAISFGLTLKPLIVGVIDILLVFTGMIIAIPRPIKFLILAIAGITAAAALLVGGMIVLVAGMTTAVTGAFFLVIAFLKAKNALTLLRKETDSATRSLNTLARAKARASRSFSFGTAAQRRIDPLRVTRVKDILKRKTDASEFGQIAVDLAAARIALNSFTGKASTSFPKVAGAAGKFSAILGAISSTLSGPFVTGVLASIGAAFEALTAFLGGSVFLAVGAIVVVVVAVKDEIFELIGAVFSLLDPFKQIFVRIKEIRGVFKGDFFGGLLKVIAVITGIGPALSVISALVRAVAKALVGAVDAIFDAIEPLVITLARTAKGVSRILGVFRKMGESLGILSKEGSLFESIFSGIFSVIGTLFAPFLFQLKLIGKVASFLIAILAGAFQGAAIAAEPIFTALAEVRRDLKKVIDDIRVQFAPMMEDLASIFGEAADDFDFFGTVVAGVSFLVRTALRTIVAPIVFLVKAFGWLLAKVLFVGGQFIAVFDGIVMKIMAVVNAVKAAAKVASEFFGLGSTSISIKQTLNKSAAEADRDAAGRPGGFTGNTSIRGAATGVVVRRDTPLFVHRAEVVAPLKQLPQLAAQLDPSVSQAAKAMPGGSQTRLEIVIPVSVMLDDLLLGQVVARIGDEAIRQQLGSRSVRLGGVG